MRTTRTKVKHPAVAYAEGVCRGKIKAPRYVILQCADFLQTYKGFQSTPPRGRRPANLADWIGDYIFQSTPPRGRRRLWSPGPEALPYFNPLRREGGDGTRYEDRKITIISIHSAARAETIPYGGDVEYQDISIHSAARAETSFSRGRQPGWKNFNPLRREGGDPAPTAQGSA